MAGIGDLLDAIYDLLPEQGDPIIPRFDKGGDNWKTQCGQVFLVNTVPVKSGLSLVKSREQPGGG